MKIMSIRLLIAIMSISCLTGCEEPPRQDTTIFSSTPSPKWEPGDEYKYKPIVRLERSADDKTIAVFYMKGQELHNEAFNHTQWSDLNNSYAKCLQVICDVPTGEELWAVAKWEVDHSRGQQFRVFYTLHLHSHEEYPKAITVKK
jgi:hypothetical protein